jgi:DNA-binding response OmpR family regulator
LKKIAIVEDDQETRNAYHDFFPVYFPEFSLEMFGTFNEAIACLPANFSEVEFVILDGELDGKKLSYPIAMALRKAGFTGGIYLVSGKDKDDVIPEKNAQAAFTDFFEKPISIKEFLERIKKKPLT